MVDTANATNQGIIITGGTINSEQVAVGANAKAEKIVHGEQNAQMIQIIIDFRKELEKLAALAKENENVLSLQVRDAISAARLEADKEKPNKVVISSILDGIHGGAKGITDIASAIIALKKLVELIVF